MSSPKYLDCYERSKSKNPSILDILSLVGGTIVQMNRRPSVWCSKYYFFSWFLAKYFAKSLSIHSFFQKITKIKLKSFEYSKSIKSLKKIILWTSDTWSTIRLSNRPSNPAWIYLRLTDLWFGLALSQWCKRSTYA